MSNVKNKKMINQIALKSLKARKKRNLIAILAIVLTSVLFTALFTIGGSLIEKKSGIYNAAGRRQCSCRI